MKAERRHELQTNALAQWLNTTFEQVQPHVNTILIGAIIVVVVIVAVVYLSGRTSGQDSKAWDAYFQASAIDEPEQRIKELARVQEDFPGTPAGLSALLMAGDSRLVQGTNAAFKDHLAGEEQLEQAEKDFQTVINGAQKLSKSEGQMLAIHASYCLARTYEAMAQHDKAVEQYEKVAKTWPDTPMGEAAAEQAKYVKSLDKWFQWYASVDPTKVKPTPRQDNRMPFGHPGGTPGQPPRPRPVENEFDLTLPGPLDLGLPGDDDIDLAPKTPGVDFESGGTDPLRDFGTEPSQP